MSKEKLVSVVIPTYNSSAARIARSPKATVQPSAARIASDLPLARSRPMLARRARKALLVSVVIPTFNAGKFMTEAVQSVLNQTYKNIEVIVVDDGSTDDTEKLVKKYPVKYIKIEHSGGPATPRNVGIQNAKGELIAFLDADDTWLPRKIEKQVRFLREKGFDLVYCDGEVVNEEDKIIKESYHQGIVTPSGNVFRELFENNFIPTSSVLVKRDCFDTLGTFDIRKNIFEDYDLWLRFSKVFKFGYLMEKLFRYRELLVSDSAQGEFRSYQRLFGVLRKHYLNARKVAGMSIKLKLWEMSKYLTTLSKKQSFSSYLKYKFVSLCYLPFELEDKRIVLREVKVWIKL